MSYILIIDDDEDFSFAAATVLRTSGHEVDVEMDIISAEKSILNRRPDCIVLDVMFPESDSAGFTFARNIRNITKDQDTIPILMLTAINSKFPLGFNSLDIDESWLPVEEFLEKPVDLDVLSGKVSAILANTV